jgi:hypothetical protein
MPSSLAADADGDPIAASDLRVTPRRITARPEEALQRAVVSLLFYCRPQCPWFACANQRGTRKRYEAEILKAMGVRAGVADLIFLNVGVIELKADEKGKLSPAQEGFREECAAFGVRHAVCWSVEGVIATLRGWGVAFAIEPVFT